MSAQPAQPPAEPHPYRLRLQRRTPRRPADLFRFGHRMGRTDACRRLWMFLNDDGRQLACAIALEGDPDDD